MHRLEKAFKAYDAVIFDAGGVILNWDPKTIVERIAENPQQAKRILEASTSHNDWNRFDQGVVSLEEIRKIVCERAEISGVVFDKFFAHILKSLTTIPQTLEGINLLKKLGKKLVLLSNMPGPIWAHLIKEYEYWNLFDGLVLSYEIKLLKPHQEIYQHLISKHKLTPSRSIFLDDREENILAAKKSGLHALQFKSMQQILDELSKSSNV